VPQVRREPKELPVLKVYRDLKVRKVLLVHKVELVQQGYLGPQAHLVRLGLLDSKDLQGLLAHKELKALLGIPGAPAHKVRLARHRV